MGRRPGKPNPQTAKMCQTLINILCVGVSGACGSPLEDWREGVLVGKSRKQAHECIRVQRPA